MSNAVAAKELGRLCYTDMNAFADRLLSVMEDRAEQRLAIDKAQVADALAQMQEEFASTDEVEADKLLRKIFNKGRVKSIKVEVNAGGGFTVTFRKQTVHGQRLSDALNNLIDQCVSLQAMGVDP